MAVNVGMASAVSCPGNIRRHIDHHPAVHVGSVSISDSNMLMVNLTSPESPRWMVHEELFEEARLVVAQTNSNSREDDVSLAVYKEIVDTLKFEKEFVSLAKESEQLLLMSVLPAGIL